MTVAAKRLRLTHLPDEADDSLTSTVSLTVHRLYRPLADGEGVCTGPGMAGRSVSDLDGVERYGSSRADAK